MRITILLLACSLILAPVQASSQQSAQVKPAANSDEQIVHVLNRLTLGARPGDIEKVRSLGIRKFIETQLQPASIPESPLVTAQVQKTPQIRQSSAELMLVFIDQIRKLQARQKDQTDAGGGGGGVGFRIPAEQGQQALPRRQREFRTGGGQAQPGSGSDDMMAAAPVPKVQIQEFGPGAQRRQGAGMLRDNMQMGFITTRLARAVESPRQLNELMTDFWFNHFNIAMSKGMDRVLVGAYEEQAIRPHVMGNFRDLLGATMHHPAMMFYLDNAQNSKAGFESRNPNFPTKGINENYARELLELHTLGVDGGYTQKDVQELARVLTGWGMPPVRKEFQVDGGYWAHFDARRHDFGEKVVIGQTIRGTGKDEIEQVLDMLSRHPSTARRISFQLAQYFVADEPPQSLVDKLATRFTQTRGNIKAVLTTLFGSPEFWDAQYRNSKFKSPFRYTISALRATGVHLQEPGAALRIQLFLNQQGQPLYQCQTPDGYKNTRETWLNPDGLMKRMDFATRLAAAQRRAAPMDYRYALSTVNGGKLSLKTQQAIEKVPDYQKTAALIGSPEFMQY
jgi:uncharacterized protein (DUF1800 family)